jgi:acetyl esterase/lipase
VKGGVKVYVQTGTAEILYDEDLALARGMKEEGVDVRLREVRFPFL